MGVPVQIGVNELMGVPEHTIRMNQKLGKVMGGWCIWKIASDMVPF